jgi:hypothetical protein
MDDRPRSDPQARHQHANWLPQIIRAGNREARTSASSKNFSNRNCWSLIYAVRQFRRRLIPCAELAADHTACGIEGADENSRFNGLGPATADLFVQGNLQAEEKKRVASRRGAALTTPSLLSRATQDSLADRESATRQLHGLPSFHQSLRATHPAPR